MNWTRVSERLNGQILVNRVHKFWVHKSEKYLNYMKDGWHFKIVSGPLSYICGHTTLGNCAEFGAECYIAEYHVDFSLHFLCQPVFISIVLVYE